MRAAALPGAAAAAASPGVSLPPCPGRASDPEGARARLRKKKKTRNQNPPTPPRPPTNFSAAAENGACRYGLFLRPGTAEGRGPQDAGRPGAAGIPERPGEVPRCGAGPATPRQSDRRINRMGQLQ